MKKRWPSGRLLGSWFHKRNPGISTAKQLGEQVGVDWSKVKFTPKQLAVGMKEELEHKDVTGGDPQLTAKIALAHLRERPDYYTMLKKCDRKKNVLTEEEEVVVLGTGNPVPKNIAEKLSRLKRIKTLGGISNVQLYKDTSTGKLYTIKRGMSPEHIREEATANQIYKLAGVRVPDFVLLDDGKSPMIVSEYIDGKQIGQVELTDKIIHDAQQGFLVDVLVGNRDVVGPEMDNLVVDKNGTTWRVDNGGSLRLRGRGTPKSYWGAKPTELQSMRKGKHNSAAIFGSLSDIQLREQYNKLKPLMPKILSSIEDVQLRNTLAKRWEEIEAQVAKNPIPISVAKSLKVVTKVEPLQEAFRTPQEQAELKQHFATAVQNTPGARLTSQGLFLELERHQKPHRAGEVSGRSGVVYLPKGDKRAWQWSSTDQGAWGGTQTITGQTLFKHPLILDGGSRYEIETGAAYRGGYAALVGGKQAAVVTQEFEDAQKRGYPTELIGSLVKRYGAADKPTLEALVSRTKGRKEDVLFAFWENLLAHEARKKGYDGVVVTGRTPQGKDYVAEIIDIREARYPTSQGKWWLREEFKKLANPIQSEFSYPSDYAQSFTKGFIQQDGRIIPSSGDSHEATARHIMPIEEINKLGKGEDHFGTAERWAIRQGLVRYINDPRALYVEFFIKPTSQQLQTMKYMAHEKEIVFDDDSKVGISKYGAVQDFNTFQRIVRQLNPTPQSYAGWILPNGSISFLGPKETHELSARAVVSAPAGESFRDAATEQGWIRFRYSDYGERLFVEVAGPVTEVQLRTLKRLKENCKEFSWDAFVGERMFSGQEIRQLIKVLKRSRMANPHRRNPEETEMQQALAGWGAWISPSGVLLPVGNREENGTHEDVARTVIAELGTQRAPYRRNIYRLLADGWVRVSYSNTRRYGMPNNPNVVALEVGVGNKPNYKQREVISDFLLYAQPQRVVFEVTDPMTGNLVDQGEGRAVQEKMGVGVMMNPFRRKRNPHFPTAGWIVPDGQVVDLKGQTHEHVAEGVLRSLGHDMSLRGSYTFYLLHYGYIRYKFAHDFGTEYLYVMVDRDFPPTHDQIAVMEAMAETVNNKVGYDVVKDRGIESSGKGLHGLIRKVNPDWGAVVRRIAGRPVEKVETVQEIRSRIKMPTVYQLADPNGHVDPMTGQVVLVPITKQTRRVRCPIGGEVLIVKWPGGKK